jgi:hypothetical protein
MNGRVPNMEDGAVFVSMVCQHEVCDLCLKKIMTGSKQCPFCRIDLSQEELQENVSCGRFYFVLSLISVGWSLFTGLSNVQFYNLKKLFESIHGGILSSHKLNFQGEGWNDVLPIIEWGLSRCIFS